MKIGLLGHGVVGSGVTAITDSCAVKKVRRLEVSKILVKDESELTDPRCTLNVEDILEDPDIEVVAECMGGLEPAHTFVARALGSGKHVVTSNKKMFAHYCEELFALAEENGVSIRYEASCGGGIPWMTNLARVKRLEAIESFRGIFNGTTNYILSRMAETGSEFAENLAEAQRLGYAEQDPTDDIDAHDVKYKTALTAVKAFNTLVDLDSIPTYGISNVAAEDFSWGKEHGLTLKLLGAGKAGEEAVSLYVMPVFVKSGDIFANVNANYNAVQSDSRTLGEAVYIGQGAGSLPTAHAVVQDLLDIYQGQDSENIAPKHLPVNNDSVKEQFYIRTQRPEVFAEVAAETAGNVIITKEISLSEVNRLISSAEDRSLFAAIVSR
ncbi:MAG: homoserine dehydrogenase [Solobacterium sp.]|nr:homoserine dehydrogenase [Solobacterium sp.]